MEFCVICGQTKYRALFTWAKDPQTGKETKLVRCKECTQKKMAMDKETLRDRLKLYSSRSKKKHRDKRNQYNKEWLANNSARYEEWKERYRPRRNAYEKSKRDSDPMFKLNHNMSCIVHRAVKGLQPWRHWESIVGYTVDQLRLCLELQFKDGMTWENYGKWHIDHIKPKSLFTFTSRNDPSFKECWGIRNLQPLWAAENIRKSNKFQRTHLQSAEAVRFDKVT